MPKLSEKDLITTVSDVSLGSDFTHMVRGGVSYKASIDYIMNNAHKVFKRSTATLERIVFRADPVANPPDTLSYVGDFVIIVNKTDGYMIVGYALDTCNTVPDDYRNSAKFMRFIDTNELL